jgi:hypothetical protein
MSPSKNHPVVQSVIPRPDEESHPTLDDDILNEGKPTPPKKGQDPNYPGVDDEQEPVPKQDEARDCEKYRSAKMSYSEDRLRNRGPAAVNRGIASGWIQGRTGPGPPRLLKAR